MKRHTHVALLAALVAATACAQDVNVYSTTIGQMWKQDTNGFDKSNFLPATEFLGIDATKVGSDKLSLHLYGWGYADLQDPSTIGGKNGGNLTYGYLQYDFDQANAQIKAGRIVVNQGIANEQVDGVFARTDLKNGFTVSAFAGVPVIYKNLSDNTQSQIAWQRDVIVGARLSWRYAKLGEIGVSYLQDGTNATVPQTTPATPNYMRQQVGVDLGLTPWDFLAVNGRTVFDVQSRPAAQPGSENSSIAEHDYSATAKVASSLSFTGTYVERNFNAYYAGTTLPSLFNMNEKGMLTATGLAMTWTPLDGLQISPDVKRTDRELYGDTTRAGADFRYSIASMHLLLGAGYHHTNAYRVVSVDANTPSFSLSHGEERAWAIYENGAFSASLDAIRFHYGDASANPSLNGKAVESQIIGSLGYQAMANLKVSGDLSVADTPLYQKQVMGLVRIEYRFGFAGKGGK